MAPAVAAPGTAGDVLLEDDAASKERRFLKWLQDNGACMDALEWPRDTPSGSRGVLTTRHVQSGESLLVIPEKLMMTPPQALQLGGGVGEAFAAHPRLMRGDNILAVYFMHECLRGKDSFYYPYLSTISEPSGLDQWPMEALSALQDGGKLMERYQMRRRQTRSLWERTFASLAETHPETFPPEDYTFELFYRAWQIVRARAFGRRLPWSALVPGADLLNHGNVQTKYELRDGLFRLFPSGANSYQAHSEALNSYGRRPNDNLLLDYGFCLL
jgi:histone-lysine N-methyltransferase SETD3